MSLALAERWDDPALAGPYRPQRRSTLKRCSVPGTGLLIRRERFRDFLLDYARRYAPEWVWDDTFRGSDWKCEGVSGWLTTRTGLNQRALHRILTGLVSDHETGEFVTFDLVDRVLCRLDATYLWHVPAEAGGFADLYELEEAA